MAVICSYCGSECGSREQANGRCGSCACFFNGTEEVVLEKAAPVPLAVQPDESATKGTDRSPVSVISNEPLSPFDPTAVEPQEMPSGPLGGPLGSEGLIQPRRLSPQFRRRVEMTWQSTFSGGHTAESTLSSKTPSTETKSESPTLSIATRKISKFAGNGKGANEGDYELKEVIGEGSMGRVWSARQTSLDRDVAVKVPMAELTGAGSVGESQFISEVVVTGKLEHPNIVPIYELGRDSTGVPFYSMKHVQGRPWNVFIDENSDQENIEILMKVCDAIAFAHDRNFLHRDIKPHNVMVGEFGEVSVMDWGIAVSITKDPDQPWASIATGPAGTPAYMAPEMAAHNPSELGVVSDVYLLGAVLYEIVTGTPPHPRTGDTGEALLSAAANEIIPTQRSGELVDIARRAMATRLQDRYQSVQELQDAIREYQSHRESIKLSESAEEHVANARRQHSSDEFARARFAYEEAIKLWDGNLAAVNGLRAATLAHAENALDQENYELGIAILDSQNPDHRSLLAKLETKRAARKRLAWFSKLAAATAVAAVLAVVGVTLYAFFQAKKTTKTLEENAITLNDNAKNLQIERDRAMSLQTRAESARDVAFRSQREARRLEGEARSEKRRAEEAPYASEIGLAAESIRRNLFTKAEKILDKLDPNQIDSDPVMSELRHIEWGLLKQNLAPAAVQSVLREEHIAAVGSSQNGSTIAAGTEDGNVLLWQGVNDLDSLPEPITFQFGTKLNAIDVSSDGRYLAAAGIRSIDANQNPSAGDFEVLVWELTSDGRVQPLPPLQHHSAEVLSLDFSMDGQRLVTSAADRTAIVWDLENSTAIAVMPDHLEEKIWNARFSPNGELVVTACEDGRVRVWDVSGPSRTLREAKKLYDFRGHDGPVYAAVFSPDGGSILSGGYDRRLLRWTLDRTSADRVAGGTELIKSLVEGKSTGGQIHAASEHEIGSLNDRHTASIQTLSVGMVGDDAYLLSGSNDNTVRVWRPDGASWTLDKVLSGHGRWIRSCVFSEQGQTVVSGAFDGVKLWSWKNYSMPRELIPDTEGRLSRQPSELGLSQAMKSIYSRDQRWVATVYDNGAVEVWDLRAPERTTGTLLVEGHAMLAATGVFYDNGNQLLTAAGDNTTRLWDVRRGTQSQKLTGTGYRGAAALSWQHDNQTAWVVTGSDDRTTTAWLWQIQPGNEPVRTALLGESMFAPSPAALQSALGLRSQGHQDVSVRLAASPLSDPRKNKPNRRNPDLTAVAYAADGQQFVIGDSAGNCFVFDFDHSTLLAKLHKTFRAHSSAVSCVAFVLDGQEIITASGEGEILRWETTSGMRRGSIPWSGPVTAMDVSTDGRRLIVGHAPMEENDFATAELFHLLDDGQISAAKLSSKDRSGNRDWSGNPPSVRSVKFSHGDDQALISLFFPATPENSADQRNLPANTTGYRVGSWDWNHPSVDFTALRSSYFGEVSSASWGVDATETQMLVVGGKGARLLVADDDQRTHFSRLAKSFRPTSSILSADFSFDPATQQSNRLVVGDNEGNVRVWEFDGQRWNANSHASVHMAGEHVAPVTAVCFDPTNPNRMITADQSGAWKIWSFDQQWSMDHQSKLDPSFKPLNFAMFSPEGANLLLGTDEQAIVWRLPQPGSDAADQGQRMMSNWLPGKVRAATYSEDGSWIVTSDGDRNVSFWNTQGDLLARMDAEDASGTTSMALSYDRRRLISGQGKRIVIWDTSRILESKDHLTIGLVKELLTLRSESDVTSVSIAPNGRHLLSSGATGQTTIWEGNAIEPISCSFANDHFSVPRDMDFKNIGASAFVSDPSRLADFSGGELLVRIVGQPQAGEEIAILATADESGTGIRLRNEQGKTSIELIPHKQAVAKRIGELKTESSDQSSLTTSLRIQFDANIDSRHVEPLMRALAYRIQPVADSTDLLDHRSDNELSSETSDVVKIEATPDDAKRLIEITLRGIHRTPAAQTSPLGTEPETPIKKPLSGQESITRTITIEWMSAADQ